MGTGGEGSPQSIRSQARACFSIPPQGEGLLDRYLLLMYLRQVVHADRLMHVLISAPEQARPSPTQRPPKMHAHLAMPDDVEPNVAPAVEDATLEYALLPGVPGTGHEGVIRDIGRIGAGNAVGSVLASRGDPSDGSPGGDDGHAASSALSAYDDIPITAPGDPSTAETSREPSRHGSVRGQNDEHAGGGSVVEEVSLEFADLTYFYVSSSLPHGQGLAIGNSANPKAKYKVSALSTSLVTERVSPARNRVSFCSVVQ